MRKLLLFIALLLVLTGTLSAQISLAQRQGLIDFYNAMDGDNWINNTGWKTDGEFSAPGTENTWFGVRLDDETSSKVFWLNLVQNNLTGELTEALLLPFRDSIRYIYFREDNITGVMPDLRTFEMLDGIVLYTTHITGSLTVDGVPKFPASISNITLGNTPVSANLTTFDWSLVPHLQYLDLRNNRAITGTLPLSFFNLYRLNFVDLENCDLSGTIPDEFSQLYALQTLSLPGNHFTGGFPLSLTELHNLRELWLSGNQLSGEIPDEIMNLHYITVNDRYSGFDLSYTALYTDNIAVVDYINSRHSVIHTPHGYLNDYRLTQTLPPVQFSGRLDADRMLHLSWTPAPNSEYSSPPNNWMPGYYKIYFSTDLINWTLIDTTANKQVTTYSAPWLGTALHNYFRIETVTTPYSSNDNILHSYPTVCRVTDMIAFDDFEYFQSWTLTGDFAIGVPQAGSNDCDAAHTPSKVLASNLNGSYLPDSPAEQNFAISPSYNCTGRQDIRLTFWSWSQFEGIGYDQGFVKLSINQGAWQTVETLDNQYEKSWTKHWINLSPQADNQSDVRIMFTYYSDSATEYTGWNIDDIMIQSVPAISGFFCIDPNGISANNFTSFNAVIDLLNTAGISNDAYFEVSAGTVYTEELFPLQATGTAEHMIKFLKVNAGANPVIISSGIALSDRDAILTLKGTDYVEFNGIDFQTTSPDMEYGVLLQNRGSTDGSRYNSINNSVISGASITGIGVVSDYQPSFASDANVANNFESIVFANCSSGITFGNNWINAGYFDADNVIRNCTFGSESYPLGTGTGFTYGIHANGQNGLVIENNTFNNLTGSQTTAIKFAGANGYIRSNVVSNLQGSIVKGIVADGAKLYNNMISLILETPQDAVITGIELTDRYNSFVDFNSINIRGGLQSISACLVTPPTAAFRVSNNVFANGTPGQGAPGRHVCVETPYANFFTSNGSLCDANLFYLPSTSSGAVGFVSSTQTMVSTLADWQTLTQQDVISYSGSAPFVSLTDLHIRTDRPTKVESNGSYLQGVAFYPWITGDIDNQDRNQTTPDIGADEGNFILSTELPYAPYALSPFDTALSVSLDSVPTLRWGISFDQNHPVDWSEVYLSTDLNSVANLDVSAHVLGDGITLYEQYTSATPLLLNQTYYWRVVGQNTSGATVGDVWSFTTENIISQYPFTEGFDTMQNPPAGWQNQYNTVADGGLSGNNLQPGMGGGWSTAWNPAYIHTGDHAIYTNSWQMPAYYWLISPQFALNSASELRFWLNFQRTETNQTELHLMAKTDSGWELLRSWNSISDNNLYESEISLSLSAYAGQNVRFALVNVAGNQGLEIGMDDFSITGQTPNTPQNIDISIGSVVSLTWDESAQATGYKVYSAPHPDGTWSLISDGTGFTTAGGRVSWQTPVTERAFYRVTLFTD